jgi:hypothetical protein
MRGTGRGQARPFNRALRLCERRQHVPLVELRGGSTVEAKEPNLGMGVKERAKIVRDRVIRDVRIKTSGSRGGGEDVPKRDALLDERNE